MRKVYLDNNATTPLHPSVKDAMVKAMESFGNPSSMHSFGREAKALIETSRSDIAKFINAKPDEMIYVGSGSEASNTVLNLVSCCSSHCSVMKDARVGVITSVIEHPCILQAAKCVKDRGLDVHYLHVDSKGLVSEDELIGYLKNGNITLVSIMAANNEIGTLQDIKRLAKITHDHGALFHTDAVQAFGKFPIDVKDWDVDYFSFSAHKIYGPKGIGAMYVKTGMPFCAFIKGGHQEHGRRAGTENTIGIVGLAEAVRCRDKEMVSEGVRLAALKERMRTDILRDIPNVRINGDTPHSLDNTLNVSFAGCEGEALLLYLDLLGIAISTGSACSSGSLDPSHVILATGAPAEVAHGSLRISMGRTTTEDDITYFLENLKTVVAKVRKMSSAY